MLSHIIIYCRAGSCFLLMHWGCLQANSSYLRIMPKTAFGNSPAFYNGLPVEKQPFRFAVHYPMASWRNLLARKQPTADRSLNSSSKHLSSSAAILAVALKRNRLAYLQNTRLV